MQSRISPAFAGFLQAAGVAVYILLGVAVGMRIAPRLEGGGPFLFLMIFSFSALLCASLVGAYPLYLFFTKEPRRAIVVIISTVLSLGTLLGLMLLATLAL
jgi:hypothetical protein